MTACYLLDTNVISEPLRPKPNPGVMSRLRQHERELVLAAPVWHELCYSCQRLPAGKRKEAIRRYLLDVIAPSIAILPYDTSAARWHADERARLEAMGRKPSFIDGQIAAIAKVNDLTLVTANGSDFAPFAGLRIENWMR